MNFHNKILKTVTAFVGLSMLLCSCESSLDVDPPGTTLIGDLAYADESTIAASMNGIYFTMASEGNFYSGAFNGDLSSLSDQAKLATTTDANIIQIAKNNVLADNLTVQSIWENSYRTIYQANVFLEKVSGRTDIDITLRDQFLGEAKFLRALCYFQLVNYYGAVPLATTSDAITNANLSRTADTEVWDFIQSELEASIGLLPTSIDAHDSSRSRATSAAAQGLLARVHLYRQNWQDAITMATAVINNPEYSIDLPVPGDFISLYDDDVPETVFELFMGEFGNFVSDILLGSAWDDPQLFLRDKFVNSFEAGDLRGDAFVVPAADGNFAYNKFDNDSGLNDDRQKIIRLSEMYLIRAEASLQLPSPDLTTATDDINEIRNRAGLADTAATTKQDLLDAVAQERYIELAFEGHRWFDLIRTGKLDEVMSAEKPDDWNLADDRYMPIPDAEIGVNPNLGN
ncbi:RagB/SusD family nutrient uptake outer membrane protein [uncultured Algibacter sp.]|uniref:RagB/SusD family nutrient uptake outer membrane protein n=1 Tax=uncultured Algibacter sp. TaxID=298659 RepID=UPI002607B758|nr:RagB/SusD family nutrient uptake outer membrane protein [uncultured Algibacter sp.]